MLEDVIARAVAWVTANGQWAGPVIGLLAFGESLVLIGMFVPATALMFAVGGLIGAGTLDPVPVILSAIVGAVLGDWLSYAIGRRIGPSAYRRWPLSGHRTGIARARLFFRRYGFASIFLGRFFGPVRATIPLVAGVIGMPPRAFQLANILSAIVWVPLLFAPGYLAANNLDLTGMVSAEQFMLIIAGLVVVPLVGSWILSVIVARRRARRRRAIRERRS